MIPLDGNVTLFWIFFVALLVGAVVQIVTMIQLVRHARRNEDMSGWFMTYMILGAIMALLLVGFVLSSPQTWQDEDGAIIIIE